MYAIDFDERTRVLHVKTEGFWNLATLAGFSSVVLARALAVKLRYGQFATLNDIRQMPVQAHDVARGFEFLMARTLAITTSPMATVASSHLARMQAARSLKADHSRVFTDMDEALAWLDAVWFQPRALTA